MSSPNRDDLINLAGKIRTAPASKPELLAPAGNLEILKIAVNNGADAVYLGASRFSARGSAENFSLKELAEGLAYAHQRSVRVYLALNTLIADSEGQAALELAAAAYTEGIDAVIVQDVGLAAALQRSLPVLPLHASTQMTLADQESLQAAARLGIKRIILPRELSGPEIRELTAQARRLGIETEVFIHGALCVCYSGQCLLSSLIGGRSGNRGSCAQPCRLPWILRGQEQRSLPAEKSGIKAHTGDSAAGLATGSMAVPWLSPRDQCLLDYLPGLWQSGVSSLKIEGRLRSGAYVGQATSAYRAALDRLDIISDDTGDFSDPAANQEGRNRLLQAFNRGGSFTDRYISGRAQKDFLSGSPAGSFGVALGAVAGCEPGQGALLVEPDPEWPFADGPARGDVLAVRRIGADQEIASAPIGDIGSEKGLLLIRGFHPDILSRFMIGDRVYRMTERRVEQEVREADQGRTDVIISIKGDATAGAVTLTASAVCGIRPNPKGQTAVTTSLAAEPVAALFPERVAQQLGKSGGTPFKVISVNQDGPVHLSIGQLNHLRRQTLADLADALVNSCRGTLPADFTAGWPTLANSQPRIRPTGAAGAKLGQVSAYWLNLPPEPEQAACGASIHYLPLYSLSEPDAAGWIRRLRQIESDSAIMAWLPPITTGLAGRLRPELLSRLLDWGLDGLCCGHPGLDYLAAPLEDKRKLILSADTGANIYNQETLNYYAAIGAEIASPSPELSIAQLRELQPAAAGCGITLEIPLYGRLRAMSSRFCPIGQNLPGCRICRKTVGNGGGPDQADLFYLEDQQRRQFPLLPHPRICCSEIFSHDLLSAAAAAGNLLEQRESAGLAQWSRPILRLYFLQETPDECRLLTGLAHRLHQAADPESRGQIAGRFRILTAQIAARLGCGIRTGQDRQTGNLEDIDT